MKCEAKKTPSDPAGDIEEAASDEAIVAALAGIVGAKYVLTDPLDVAPFYVDARSRYRGQAIAAVKPASTDEVAKIVRFCATERIAVVPQGGNTGQCGGATPMGRHRAIVLRLDRMNRIREVNPIDNTMTVEAGCILTDLQNAAEAADRFFPLSLGAEGTCQIGGNISTNAGGTRVVRYGNMRDLVLGLEVVLPDGQVFNRLRRLRKDNTGYDLKQLMIGAEGTLGVITAAVLKIFPKPRVSAAALLAISDVGRALEVLALAKAQLSERLSSIEIMSASQIEVIESNMPEVPLPLPGRAPYYLLVEATDTAANGDLGDNFEAMLTEAYERGFVQDATVATSDAQVATFWHIRHAVTEANQRGGLGLSYDTSVPLDRQPDFVERTGPRIQAAYPDAKVLFVGHIGDGNIHVVVLLDRRRFAASEAYEAAAAAINDIVDDVTLSLDGSISAEHGIGITNRQRLVRNAGGIEIELMRRVKKALDPLSIMNPGKVLFES
jgi:FAD/FMN-containing dehydrogenase